MQRKTELETTEYNLQDEQQSQREQVGTNVIDPDAAKFLSSRTMAAHHGSFVKAHNRWYLFFLFYRVH